MPCAIRQQENRVIVARPRDRIRRIRHDYFKRLVIPMRGVDKRIAVRYIELIRLDVVQKHIDSAKVIRRDIYFLSEKALTDIVFAENLRCFQKKRTRAARGIVNLVYFRFADDGKFC